MNVFEVSKSILLKLVNEDVPFAVVLKNTFKKTNVDPAFKNDVAAIVGCELRHHYIFDNLVNRFFDGVEFEKTIYLRFALANGLFLRRFSDTEIIALAEQELDKETIYQLYNFVKSTNEIIPNELDKASPEYLSYRYNTPAWVIRMWQKQYGKGVVFKTLKVNYRQSVPSIRVNEKNIDIDEFLGKHPDFSKAPIDNMIIYQGRGTPKKLPEFESGDLFFMKMATKYILDILDLDVLKGIAIYTEVPNNIYLDLLTRFSEDTKLDLVINNTFCYYEVKRNLQKVAKHHIFVYEAEYSSLLTCLSKKVHTMICMPKSSTFDLLRSTPDYFLRIKQDKLDEIIANESACLLECSKYVEEGGELVYMIPTLSRKESNNVIAKFLVDNKDFELVEERQFFPFEVYDSCLYFARLKKVEK